jgi:hypothetical protein
MKVKGLADDQTTIVYIFMSYIIDIEILSLIRPAILRISTSPIDPIDPIDPINPIDPIDPIDPIEPWASKARDIRRWSLSTMLGCISLVGASHALHP